LLCGRPEPIIRGLQSAIRREQPGMVTATDLQPAARPSVAKENAVKPGQEDLAVYYARRAREYDSIYRKPERQEGLRYTGRNEC